MGKRTERLSGQIAREIGKIIQLEVRDPRVGFATVSRVDLTNDLSVAKVFVSVFGDEKERKGAMIALERSAAYMRKLLAQRLHMRHVPEIRFQLDLNLDHSDRIAELLSEVKTDVNAQVDTDEEQP